MKLSDKKINNSVINISLNSEIKINQEIDDTDLDGETVMMDFERGQYFALNDVGSRIWELAKNKIKVSEIVETLLNEYDVERDECEEEVVKFIDKLYDDQLVKVL